MRAIRLSFLHMLKLIRQDRMLLVAGLAPLLAGIAMFPWQKAAWFA